MRGDLPEPSTTPGSDRLGPWLERLAVLLMLLGVAGTLAMILAVHQRRVATRRMPAPPPVVAAPVAPDPAEEIGGQGDAVVVAEPESEPEPVPEPEPVVDPTAEALARIDAERQELIAEAETKLDRLGTLGRALEDREERIASAIGLAERAKGKVAALRAEADRLEADAQFVGFERDVLDRRKVETEESLRKAAENPGYAILPYRGPNGTWRRPIAVECVNGGATIQPGGTRFSLLELSPIRGSAGAFAAVIVRVASLLQIEGAPDGTPVEPYVLFVVRPDGIRPFYEARGVLDMLDIPYGYELVEQDLEVEFPSWDDPTIWGALSAPTPAPSTIAGGDGLGGLPNLDDMMPPDVPSMADLAAEAAAGLDPGIGGGLGGGTGGGLVAGAGGGGGGGAWPFKPGAGDQGDDGFGDEERGDWSVVYPEDGPTAIPGTGGGPDPLGGALAGLGEPGGGVGNGMDATGGAFGGIQEQLGAGQPPPAVSTEDSRGRLSHTGAETPKSFLDPSFDGNGGQTGGGGNGLGPGGHPGDGRGGGGHDPRGVPSRPGGSELAGVPAPNGPGGGQAGGASSIPLPPLPGTVGNGQPGGVDGGTGTPAGGRWPAGSGAGGTGGRFARGGVDGPGDLAIRGDAPAGGRPDGGRVAAEAPDEAASRALAEAIERWGGGQRDLGASLLDATGGLRDGLEGLRASEAAEAWAANGRSGMPGTTGGAGQASGGSAATGGSAASGGAARQAADRVRGPGDRPAAGGGRARDRGARGRAEAARRPGGSAASGRSSGRPSWSSPAVGTG